MKLSPNFVLEEFTVSEIAARRGLDNTPSADVVDNLRLLATFLEELRTLVKSPIVVLSGYRSEAVNMAVGGVGASAHQFGHAADIIAPGFGPPLSLCRAVVSLNQPFDQVIHEFGSWCHVSIDPRTRRQQLTICRGGTYQRGLLACS